MSSSDTASPSAPIEAAGVSAEKDTVRRVSPRGVDEEGTASPAGARQPMPAEERARLTKEYAGRIAREFVHNIANLVLGYMSYSYRMTTKMCDLEKALDRYAAEETRGMPKYWKDAICANDDEEDWDECVGGEDTEYEDDCEILEGCKECEDNGPMVMDKSFCRTTAEADAEGPERFFGIFPATTAQEGGMSREQVVTLWDDVLAEDYRSFVRPPSHLETSFFDLLSRALDAYITSALVRPRNLGGAFERVSSNTSMA